ncbi:MAG: hypothetical protein JNJ65_18010 [Cyclobacteriaceae bacterium]|nr:hypothetical protein [Cyclobacteriaceae bacterium]
MKKLYFLFLLALVSCFSEEGVEIGASETFIRYFNGGNNDAAVAVAETSDQGYIILANSQLEDGRYKIKLVKTDALGNKVWTQVYPGFIAKGDPLYSRKGNGLYLIPGGGYVVAGEDIDASGKSQLYVLVLDNDGKVTAERQYASNPANLSVRGIAITESQTGSSFLILANILNSLEDNMVAAEINKSDLSITWSRAYGSGDAAYLVNKLFLDTQNKLVWGGTVTRQNGADVRLVRTIQNSLNTDFDLPIGRPNFNEFGVDITRFGFGYAVSGSTDSTSTGEREILVQRLAEDGTVIFSTAYPFTTLFQGEEVPVPGNKIGNAIASTRDGGLFIAGTVPSNAGIEFGKGETDYYLIKTDGFGNVMWQKPIGSRFADRSVAVLQSSDGNLVLCGNTTLAGLGTIMLMKMDSEGNVQ